MPNLARLRHVLGVRIAPLAPVALLSALLSALALALTSCTGSTPAARSHPTGQVTFTPTVTVVKAPGATPSAGDTPSDGSGGSGGSGGSNGSDGVVAMLTDWYQRAFVDPAAWGDGRFSFVADHFTGQAKTKVLSEIESVSIGSARTRVESVRPDPATVALTVYVDATGSPLYAIATVTFAAQATMKDGSPPLSIAQSGVYYLRREGSDWKIFSYQARNDEKQVPPASGSPASGRVTGQSAGASQ